MSAAFHSLTARVMEAEHLWRPRPFASRTLQWMEDWPRLADELLRLSEEEVSKLDQNPLLLRERVPELRDWVDWWESELDSHMDEKPPPALPHTMRGIPARKREQIEWFTEALTQQTNLNKNESWIEWCAGKGYLASALLNRCGIQVTCLEKSARILRAGEKHRAYPGLTYHQCDVTKSEVFPLLQHATGVVGLHACGTLTDRLLEVGIQAQIPHLFVSPCCYHAGAGNERIRWSTHGKNQGPRLSAQELRLVTAETVHARSALRQRRKREMEFRLGLEEWRYKLTGEPQYIPQGNFSSSVFQNSFSDFLAIGCARLGIEAPTSQSLAETFQKAGQNRAADVRRLALLRGLFRRPLEKWINLDRVEGLRERGHDASLSTFCSEKITPRNYLIHVHTRGERTGA